MNLGRKIGDLRRKRGESLQQVADAVGVSKAHIWELEKGRTANPAMALVTRLADHFGVSVGFLVGEDLDASDDDVQLARMFRQARELTERDRKVIDDLLQSFRKQKRDAAET